MARSRSEASQAARSPPAGRKVSLRRTCRTAGSGSGRTPPKRASQSSTCGLSRAARRCGPELPYPETEHLSVADGLTMERDTLTRMVAAFDGYVETIVSVLSTCLVSIERNKYSVPCAFANQKVSVRLYSDWGEAQDENGVVGDP